MENFKTIEGYDNYEISDHGNVRNKKTGRILALIINCYGYCCVNLCQDKKRKLFYVHRLVAFTFLENHDNKREVDHINHETQNNTVNNLRWATSSQNQHNKKISSNNSSGFKGICFHKLKQKWYARIILNYKSIHIGYFDELSDAEMAIKEARERLHGEYFNHG
jgi:hypothetical protein